MSKSTRPESGSQEPERTLGTFAGVFTPSILTIIGIILYLRLGYVVGSAGLSRALIIIAVANIISVLTSLSLAAIATNMYTKVGGYYYLISRTLGAEFGGSIGVVLYLAQSISIGFYCVGFGEALAGLMPFSPMISPQPVAALLVAFLFVFAWLGANWATRLQYVVMAIIAASLISFYIGGLAHFSGEIFTGNWTIPSKGGSFWILFAIFFPAVTGFSQGVSMSGDLKDPAKSLPLGTFLAVGISIFVYFSVAIVFAGVVPAEELSGNYQAMTDVASVGWLISAGVLAATLSSAMASFLGAPRILQSMAQDRILPFIVPFARGAGPTNNPRRGVLVSAVIALATVGLGKLNLIAPVVSMFFLVSYGLLNYATFYEARALSPSFRPTFRWFDYRLSFIGAAGCLAVMIAIDFISTIIAVAVLFGIYQYLQRTAGPARWADSKHSYHFKLMRDHMFNIPADLEHPRDWRPQILAFSDDEHRRGRLLCFASWIEGGSGFTTAVRIIEGKGKKIYQLRKEYETEIRADISKCGMKAFAKVIAVPDLRVGVQTLIQSFGIGPIRPNTILINGPEQVKDIKGQRQYGRYFSEGIGLGCNVIVLNSEEEAWDKMKNLDSEKRRIDIWWQDDMTGRLMLLLAYLMKRNKEWSNAELCIWISSSRKDAASGREHLRQILEEVRIDAEPKTVESAKIDTIAEKSKNAAMVFIPFHIQKNRPVGPFGVFLDTVFSRLPIVALVIAAEDIDLGAEPEDGKPGEIAAAEDEAADFEKKARAAESEAVKLAETVKLKLRELESADKDEENEEKTKELKQAVHEAEKLEKRAKEETEKARAQADEAAQLVKKITGKPSEEDEETKN